MIEGYKLCRFRIVTTDKYTRSSLHPRDPHPPHPANISTHRVHRRSSEESIYLPLAAFRDNLRGYFVDYHCRGFRAMGGNKRAEFEWHQLQ